MNSRVSAVLVAVVAGGLLSPPAVALNITGKYEYTKRWSWREGDLRIKYTLDLKRDGRYELVSELSTDDKDRLPERAFEENGDILDILVRKRRAVEKGDWLRRGTTVSLDIAELDGRKRNGRYAAEWRRDALHLHDYPRNLYGRTDFELKPKRFRPDWSSEGRPDRPDRPDRPSDDERLFGTWYTNIAIPGDDGRLIRMLELSSNGSAQITSMYSRRGYEPSVTSEGIERLGRIFGKLTKHMPGLIHTGKWDARGSEITVELDKLGRDRISDRLQFRLVRSDLVATGYSRDLYGSTQFVLGKEIGYIPRRDAAEPRSEPKDRSNRDAFAGTAVAMQKLRGEDGYMERKLELKENGVAYLSTKFVGSGDPNRIRGARAEWGRLVQMLDDEKRDLKHEGTWVSRGDTLILSLTTIGRDSYRETFRFRYTGSAFEPLEVNRDLYGAAPLVLRK